MIYPVDCTIWWATFRKSSMREVRIEKNKSAIDFAYRVMTGEIGVVIFLTESVFRHLLAAIEPHVDKQTLSRFSFRHRYNRARPETSRCHERGWITTNTSCPEPNTWRELLQVIDQHVPIANQSVGLQEYG